jgi:hypothetical protein
MTAKANSSSHRVFVSVAWGPRLEHFLYNGVAALLATPHPTLIDLPRLYTDERFRDRVVARVTDPAIGQFWRHEYLSYDRHFQAEAAAPILNKIGQIAASPVLRSILGQNSPKFDLSYAMNNRKILISNLAKGRIPSLVGREYLGSDEN